VTSDRVTWAAAVLFLGGFLAAAVWMIVRRPRDPEDGWGGPPDGGIEVAA
jgi:hypothetical protein